MGSTIEAQHLASGVRFGASVTWLGDVDGDGAMDAAVGAPGARAMEGAVFLLRINVTSGEAIEITTVGSFEGGLERGLSIASEFGASVLGGPEIDVNGDGVPDLIVGAPGLSAGWVGVA